MDTKKLRRKILDLAIHGKLVPQDPNDEPASVLLERIRAEKERLISEGKIKRSKKSATSDTSHYEDVPFEVPEGWCWTSLNSICTIFGRIGFRGYTKDDLVDSTGAITLSPSNIVDGVMNYEKCTYISWEKYEESPEIQVQNEDILLVKTGSSYGKCAYVESLPKEATINPQFVVLKFIGSNPRFLTYCLQSNYARKQYEEFVLGTAIPTFTQVALGSMAIPIPPIEEQERIVAEVEKLLSFVDSLNENTKELGNVITVAKSKILDLAIHGKLVPQDANDEPASELLKRINPKAVTSCDNPHYENVPFEIPDNWAWVRIDEINKFKSKSVNPQNYPTNQFELYSVPSFETGDPEFPYGKDVASSKVEVGEGDVLLCKINTHLNRVWIVRRRKEQLKSLASSEWIVIRTDEIMPEYLALTMQSPYFRELMKSNVSGVGGSLMRAQPTFVKQYMIPIPPYNEQIRIVDKIQETFKTLGSIAESLN